jgi:hypothetical protein
MVEASQTPRAARSLGLALGFIAVAVIAMVGAVYYAFVNGGPQ